MTLGGKTAIMRFVRWNVMSVCPLPVGRAEASIAAPFLHRIRKDVLHALVAVKLDDLFYRTLFRCIPSKFSRMRISIPPAQAQFSRKLSRHFRSRRARVRFWHCRDKLGSYSASLFSLSAVRISFSAYRLCPEASRHCRIERGTSVRSCLYDAG